MVTTQLSPTLLSLGIAAGTVGVLVTPWLLRIPRGAVTALVATLVLGQLVRIPLPGQGGGLLVSDLALAVSICAALYAKVLTPSKKYRIRRNHSDTKAVQYGLLVAPFIIWSAFTLLIQLPHLGPTDGAIAAAYWVRLSANLLALPALLLLLKNDSVRGFTERALDIALVIMVMIGAVQLWLVPDLSILGQFGWDPHQGRMVATWLDPNFLGVFLAMMMTFSMGRSSNRRPIQLLILVALVAIVLTQSRTALIASGTTALIFLPLLLARHLHQPTPSRFLMIVSLAGLSIVGGIIGTMLLWPRIVGVIQLDTTATLRLEAIQQAWPIAVNNSLVGVGYNAYQFAAKNADNINNFTIHSRAGTDNSLLTLWATTGLIGVVLFLLPWAVITHALWRGWLQHKKAEALAASAALCILFVSSQFINSLLYSHLLITAVIIASVALRTPHRAWSK